MSDTYTPELIEQIRIGWKRLGGKYSASQLAKRLGLESRNCIISAAHRCGLVPSRSTALKSARNAAQRASLQAEQEIEHSSDEGRGIDRRDIISLALGQTYDSQTLQISPAWPEPLPILKRQRPSGQGSET